MKRLLSFLLGLGLGAMVLCTAATAYADPNDFVVTSFTAHETLTRGDPQGVLRIVERISVDFNDNNHGILRAIPETYKSHRLLAHVNKISSESGAPASFSSYRQNGNLVLKIGDPARTVTGPQEYTVDYTVRNVITFYKDHDELFWDINGDQWAQPFGEVGVQLDVPAGAHFSRAPVCYAGAFGSRAHNCHIATHAGTLSASTDAPLPGHQTLSLVAGFDKGYFHPYTWQDTLGEYAADIVVFVLPVLLLGGTSGLYWFRHGRDPRGKRVIVPEYSPPEGLGPIEVGTLIDFRTDNKDITAAIIDLAVRRYITIVEQKQQRKLLPDVTSYMLRLEKPGFGELNEFERTIITGLFEGNSEVDLAQRKNKLMTTASTLRTTVKKSLETRGYFRPSPFGFRVLGQCVLCIIATAIVGGVAAHFAAGPAFGAGVFIGACLAGVSFANLASRTAKGVAAKEQVMGLKMYLEVAEKDRIRALQSPDARYAANMHQPTRTVELFEKLLPYAMILGVEQQWAKQFENIYRTPPDWYAGNWSSFNAVYLASSLSSGIGQQVNAAFTAPSSSGGSGFGGGAGGGGGGGGGGGW